MTGLSGGDDDSSLASVGLGVLELLHEDHQRPSFVVDLKHEFAGTVTPRICYRSTKFTAEYDFERSARNADVLDDVNQLYFRNWAFSRHTQETRSTINFHGLVWFGTVLRKRWKVIQATTSTKFQPGVSEDSDSDSQHELRHAGVLRHLPKGSSEAHHEFVHGLMQKARPHDWTLVRPPKYMSDHVRFLRQWDWSKTPFGPLDRWSPRLRMIANVIVADPNPAVVFWGPELAGIYNEAYVPLLHDKHPKALGEPYHKTWSELYRQEAVAKEIDHVWKEVSEGKSVVMLNRPFYLRNGNMLQEHIFNLIFIPIVDEEGKTIAFYEPVKEITRETLGERRATTIKAIAELTTGEEHLDNFFKKVVSALEPNVNDVPFALLYSFDSPVAKQGGPINLETALANGEARLQASLGVRTDDDDVPEVQSLLMEDDSFLDLFDQIVHTRQMETFSLIERPDTAASIMEKRPTRAFGDQTRVSLLVPIEPIAQKGVSAVLFMGLNPRRPYDADYESFVRQLSRAISSSWASLILNNENKRIVGEALEMEKKAMSMLEASPVGACLLQMDGAIVYANKGWHEITGYSGKSYKSFDWYSIVEDDHLSMIQQEWETVAEQKIARTFEVQLKKAFDYTDPTTREHIRDKTWILISAVVQQIGEVDYVISAVTDVSLSRWMRQKALNMKKQQERFMDMTSHEMRNPLSAIFQCADAIVNSLSAFQQNGFGLAPDLSPTSRRLGAATKATGSLDEAVEQAIENAGIITLCAQHQKRIVDDVLVLSKVDANLIEVHPVDVQPRILVANTIKMFTAELAANQAKMTLEIESSFEALNVDWVKLDPGRVLQILINLCTNAIKFSMDSELRSISITVGASTSIPSHSTRGVRFLHSVTMQEDSVDLTTRPEWGIGEVLYLQFQVTDSGKGMTQEEMKLLFQRFSQASPRTHTQYGGSGLGLFIARLLSRLQGGEIGVMSSPDQGSTFAFYIKVRRAKTPHGIDVHTVVPQVNLPVAMHDPLSPSAGIATHSWIKDTADVSILIVEDNLVNQRVLSRQLKAQGFTVYTANNGAECLHFLEGTTYWHTSALHHKHHRHQQGQLEQEPQNRTASSTSRRSSVSPPRSLSVILMDIEMPVMNGTEAARRIRDYQASGELLAHVPIIAITANARLEQIEVAQDAGMDEVVSKPFRIPELIAKIETFVGPLASQNRPTTGSGGPLGSIAAPSPTTG